MSNDNPTFIDYNGSKFWKNKKNQLHRIGGPAVDHFDGSKSWYVNDKLHRLDGPAIEWPNGHKSWYVNDKLHRLDGPAMVWPSGNNQWYKNNVRFKNKEKFFEALTEAEKEIALFSEDFLNG
jgi:hypothetical protein